MKVLILQAIFLPLLVGANSFAASYVSVQTGEVRALHKRFVDRAVYCRITNLNSPQIGTVRHASRRIFFSRLVLGNRATKKERTKFKTLKVACQKLAQGIQRSQTPPPRHCTVSASQPQDLELVENSSIDIPLDGQASCPDLATHWEAVNLPQHGAVNNRSNGGLTYQADFFDGTDEFQVRLCVPVTGDCSSPVRVTARIHAAQYSGNPQSLAPYKDQPSEHEIRSLLKRVAFGGCQALVDKGLDQGLSAMVDVMLDDPWGGCPEPRFQFMGHDYSLQDWICRPDQPRHPYCYPSGNADFQFDRPDLFDKRVFLETRYGNPLRHYMALAIWHNHFATNLFVAGLPHHQLHYDRLYGYALGSFSELIKSFYAPVPEPILSSTPFYETPMRRDFLDVSGHLLFPHNGSQGMYGDMAYQRFLDNDRNTRTALNLNLGRELLELHLLGERNFFTGARNYTEDDVVASAKAITGLTLSHSDNDGNVPMPYREHLIFDEALTQPANPAETITIFAGTSSEHSANYHWDTFLNFLLEQNTKASETLALKLFTQIAHTSPNELTVAQLAAMLREPAAVTNPFTGARETRTFSIENIMRTLLKSQAMFSSAAIGSGYSSPLEVFQSFLRNADLDFIQQFSPDVMRSILNDAGYTLFAPPTVFGWNNYGVVRNGIVQDGSVWIEVSSLLGTQRGIMSLLNWIFQSPAEAFDGRRLLPAGAQSTPEELVDAILRRFNLSLGAEERAVLVEYTSGPEAWAPSDLWAMKKKVAGLLFLIGTHPANLIRE